MFFLNYLNINFNDFYHQYIAYPLNIGTNRYGSLNNSIESLFNQYKFLILPITIISIIKLKKIKNKELNFFSTEFINFLIILALCASLIFHQISTRNQIYIYFLIPICFALLETNIKDSNVKLKKYFSFSIIIFVLFITLKYHFRYNETRKFHELENVNLKNAVFFATNGDVFPCCYTYQRVYLTSRLQANDFISKTYEKYGKEFINVNAHSFEQILKNEWYGKNLVDSFGQKLQDEINPKLHRCAHKCGQSLESRPDLKFAHQTF